MSEQKPVPLIILGPTRDPVDAINGILRRAGHPVHCTWIPSLRDLGDALAQLNPELLLLVDTGAEDLKAAAHFRDQMAPTVPLVLVADKVDEAHIGAALELGARDVISLANPKRLEAVMVRELRSFRLERALESTLKAARDTRKQLETVLQRSADAIAQVQEGIMVDANASWLELFGCAEAQLIVGQPIMDLFEDGAHAALKGALAACLQGRWSDHSLKLNGVLADGSSLPVELVLTAGEHDGEPCVRLIVPARPRDEKRLADELTDAVTRDAATGLLQRRALLETLKAKLTAPTPPGVRYFALIKPDKFATIEHDVGIFASEDFLIAFAQVLKEQLHAKDVAGRLGGVSFLVMLERGNERDVEAWAGQLIAKVSKHVVRIGDKSLSATCTVGLSVVPPSGANVDSIAVDAMEAVRKGEKRGGNQVVYSDRADTDTRVQSYDSVWVKHIKSALMENRFRLVQQPVASLQGDDLDMHDVLVRMLDPQGKEVLPLEFMAAAERNDLLKNIDRWVVGASLSFAAQTKPGCLFVRLSKDTAKDASFLDWLVNHIRSSHAEPHRLCFQVTEDIAATHQAQIRALSTELHKHGFRFALEAFGSGRDPQGLLCSLPLDFVKIDGAMVQGLAGSEELQQRVRALVDTAKSRNVGTIAERVEDANTMAVLWQLGVQFIQGYFVNAPEQVVMSAG